LSSKKDSSTQNLITVDTTYTMKFIYKNDKEKQRFLENYEKSLLLYNKIMLFGENFQEVNSSRSSESELKRVSKQIRVGSDCNSLFFTYNIVFEKEKTLVIVDLHRLLLFIRETKQTSTDIVISSKSGLVKPSNQLPIKVTFIFYRL